MSQSGSNEKSALGRLIVTGGIAYGLWLFPLDRIHDPMMQGVWWFGAICVGLGVLKTIRPVQNGISQFFLYLKAFGGDRSKGSAGLMREREIRRAKLHRRVDGSRLIGSVRGTALWLWTETHHLIIGPAGSSKTSAAITNILMGSPESALINDIKGELWMITRDHRATAFGHDVLKIDPKDPANSIKFNPLEDIADDIAANRPSALSRTRGVALQLLPDPKDGGGANAVFYQGGRNLMVTVILAVCVVLPPEYRTLAMVNRAINDKDVLHDLLDAASKCPALNGEIADMAGSTHSQAFGDDGNAKTFESFRIQAALAMEAYGPGNYLAAITSETTFRFTELKSRKVSLYITIDYANASVLASFSGLVQHLAAEAMVSEGTNTPVLFCLDEFTNAKCEKLCSILTLLRSAGVRVVMATQDLNDIERVYSKHDLETVLSESHIKQFLGGIRSKKTLEWLASYLGEYTETVSSFSMRPGQEQESLARSNRKLLTEDELRRLPDQAQIVLYGNQKPILAKKVQVFAIDRWRLTLGINTSYGHTRKLLPVELRLRRTGAKVTWRARRAYRAIERQMGLQREGRLRILARYYARVALMPLVVVGLIAALVLEGPGLPNLRWNYAYSGSARQTPMSHHWCRYIGPTSPGVLRGHDCPLILWR